MTDEAIIKAQKKLIEAQRNLISVMNNELDFSDKKTAVSRREMLWEEKKEITFSEYVQTFLKSLLIKSQEFFEILSKKL